MVTSRKSLQLDARTRKKQGPKMSFEKARAVLEAEGFHDYAFVMPDGTGHARVHTVGEGRRFLDGAAFTGQNEQATALLSLPLSLPSSVGREVTNIDFEDNQIPVRSMRRGRMPHLRGRTMLPEMDDTLHASFASSSRQTSNHIKGAAVTTTADVQEEATGSSSPAPPFQSKSNWSSFRLDDEDSVVTFLESRFRLMQQLADKKIAKAWIKGICPKKQAKYPYSAYKEGRSSDEEAVSKLPPFWPSTEVCPFKEPDHIRRDERMSLLIHLLRLRPSPEQLSTWNDDDSEYNEIHVTQGWTAFLKDLAGPETFDEMPRTPIDKVKKRRKYMDQMYEIASMEEEIQNEERDPTERYYYEPDEDDDRSPTQPPPAPSAPTPSASTKRTRARSDSSTAPPMSRESSKSADHARAKRPREDSKPVVDEKMAVAQLQPQENDQKPQKRRKSTQMRASRSPAAVVSDTIPARREPVCHPQPRKGSCPELALELINEKQESCSRPSRRASGQAPTFRTSDGNRWHGGRETVPSHVFDGSAHVQGPAMFELQANPSHFLGRQSLPQYSAGPSMADVSQAEPASQSAFRTSYGVHFPPTMPALQEPFNMSQYSSSEQEYAMTAASSHCFVPSVMAHHMMDMQLLAPQAWPLMNDQSFSGAPMMHDYHDLPFDYQTQPWGTQV